MKKNDCVDMDNCKNNLSKPKCDVILKNLKDFQKDTVDYVFRRLYTDEDCTRRFLVADEVGLGKTLVARGVIAKTIEHLWEDVPRIDIIYICSNSNIARQNIARLNVLGDDTPKSRRISLLPTVIEDLNARKVNFISLTPGTSFDMSSGTGIGDERALLYWLLKEEWGLQGEADKKIFRGSMKLMNFKKLLKEYPKRHSIDPHLKASFLSIVDGTNEAVGDCGIVLKNRVQELSNAFSEPGLSISRKRELEKESNRCISELRGLLVRSCLKALEPDLIILDEFQRFKHLMYGQDDESESATSARELAKELFTYADENSEARVLLLSATPYKMYTTANESGMEDHHEDFLKTLEFLVQDPETVGLCKNLIRDYRRELFRVGSGYDAHLVQLKELLEAQLRRVMVRTERLAASEDRNGMLVEISDGSAKLQPSDLMAYYCLQNVAGYLHSRDPLEYWKSSPYTLNFMDKYDLKQAFSKACSHRDQEILSHLSGAEELLLPWKEIKAYSEIDPRNARLRSLLAGTIDADAWKLLWLPPSLPYYELGSPFSNQKLSNFTKRLVFSSWRMVPRMIASLVSYEAERKIISHYDPYIRNQPESRKKLRPLLKFARSDRDRSLTGLPILGIIYPSITLAKACDPMRMASMNITSADDVIQKARIEIERLIMPLTRHSPEDGPEDDNWYWAAPILLDMYHHRDSAEKFFRNRRLVDLWGGEETYEDERDEGPSRWKDAISEVTKLLEGEIEPKRPPVDLSLVLAKLAIAGPGTTSLRALARITGGLYSVGNKEHLDKVTFSAMGISRAFIRLFNSPTSNALLRGLYASDSRGAQAYWRQVLDYCFNGGLQAVLDEYVHFLKESEGLLDYDRVKAAKRISETVVAALSLRTASLDIDEIRIDDNSDYVTRSIKKMRTNFAVMLSDKKSEEGQSENRISQVRMAFNSPFWPFVLATTSIGQEGLDFHAYCHAVVHWNLPSNPVDLEQREGRIHRFKGHAIRKNLAENYGLSEIGSNDADPWESLFMAGKRDREDGSTDLVPFWIYPEGRARIERHVPALPLSRDRERLKQLQESLVIYRMVFGQSRQEDLLAFLMDQLNNEDMDKLRIDLSPPQARQRGYFSRTDVTR
ncbi:DEAD/DEAH box helicase [Candidatus Methanocrinis natronophilus]|uniref:Helicase-related protein n=1 Tax=Candidatus Methanocrinis natronophilus TaxID=3033396 RepID=A0ABT5X9Z9_9EURY|nr:helicase-related protein [Candidatus Methanocrinis natronophilus]MDF0591544.1 helicase-related protein [Candidatus Methanocrinis natronophilus]